MPDPTVPLPHGDPMTTPTIATIEQAWAERDGLQASLDAAHEVLRDLVDDEPCVHDHHGYCQTHCWLDEGTCANKRALALLAEADAITRARDGGDDV